MTTSACSLCAGLGGALVFRGKAFRVIRADEAGFPAFYRVVWSEHVAEFSDLDAEDRSLCMRAVHEVEQVLREHLQPTKINLAALGNMVPHLHWHVIARFEWDSHFPAPLWAPPQRQVDPVRLQALQQQLPLVEQALTGRLAAWA